jgi:hypothetical protein
LNEINTQSSTQQQEVAIVDAGEHCGPTLQSLGIQQALEERRMKMEAGESSSSAQAVEDNGELDLTGWCFIALHFHFYCF